MTTASKAPFPFPLQLGALDLFCHPTDPDFMAPMWKDAQALVGCGWIALRVDRGYWDASDFEPASAAFLARFETLPWSRFTGIPDEWQRLDDIRGRLYRHAPVYPWTAKGKCAPSRVWRVGETFLGRLSHLQLIARLPRCEVHLGVMGREAPLLFRFNGGLGMLAADKNLTEAGFSVFQPNTSYDGVKIPKNQGPCVLPKPAPYWKAFEPTDP
jgi:hypothetical protein